MNEEKQIEEMAKDICHAPNCDLRKKGKPCYKYCKAYIYAFRAQNRGYRKASDVVEVRHGHWIKEFAWSYGYTDHHKLTCSECGLTFTEDARSVDEYKYCYGCGAKMDLEGRSENEG
jgi:hypothetical protein